MVLPAHAPAPVDLSVQGWGVPSRSTTLPSHAVTWLEETLGRLTPSPPASPPRPSAPGALPEGLRRELTALLGEGGLATDDGARLVRAAGRSYLDLLALRAGGPVPCPDAVALPSTAGEVAAVLAACSRAGVAVVPFGGGTSVVGGVAPVGGSHPAVLSVDLRRLDRLVSLDTTDLVATFEPGVRAPAAESMLAERGLTLGHFPQSFEHASLGGFAATRSAGQASSGYGRFDDLVVGAVLQTPRGELRVGRGAASAAGPDLLDLVLGSEGALGVLTEVSVRVRRRPATARHEGFFFRTWQDGCAGLRTLEQAGLSPDVARLSDPDETRVQLALAGPGGVKGRAGRLLLGARGYGRGCLAVLGWHGDADDVSRRRRAAVTALRGHGAFAAGRSVGERWEHGRYDGPYLRDALLDAGALVETLETSATWSRLLPTWAAIRAALTAALPDSPPVVMCHVSHLYPHGASLYFTVLARRSPDDPLGQWQRAKDAAGAAIVAAGATITHHHAVGTDHRPWMIDEVGPLGAEVLRSVKATLDPAGICNPGKLVPDLAAEGA